MNIEKAKRAMEGMPINYAPGMTAAEDMHKIKVSFTADFKSVIEDLAFEEGRTMATLLRLAIKNYVQDAIYKQEAREGRYNWTPDAQPQFPGQFGGHR